MDGPRVDATSDTILIRGSQTSRMVANPPIQLILVHVWLTPRALPSKALGPAAEDQVVP